MYITGTYISKNFKRKQQKKKWRDLGFNVSRKGNVSFIMYYLTYCQNVKKHPLSKYY